MKIPSDAHAFVEKLRNGDRATLGRAISFVESTAPAHRSFKRTLISAVDGAQENAYRIAITGVPGLARVRLSSGLGSI